MNFSSIILGLIIFLNFIFALVVVFKERRDAGATWAWLLVLSFIPIAGFMLYLLFAQNFRHVRLFHWGDLKKIGVEEIILEQLDQIQTGKYQFRNQSASKNRDLIYMHLNNNHSIFTEENAVDIITDGQEKFDKLFKDIDAAKDYIHIQYYIIQNDNLGKKLMNILTQKAREGVKVRVLYDQLGSKKLTRRFFHDFRAAGGLAEAFFPSKLRLINLRLNYRNHRKLVIIDGEIGFVGGFNVGDEYLGLNSKFGYWRDTHLRITGSAVYAMQIRFILDWNQATHHHSITYSPNLFPRVDLAGKIGMQIVTSGPDSEFEHIKNGYIKMISSAKKSIYIQTPYFIPDASLLDALRIAALSGVEVKIMIPDKPDHIFVYWATYSYIGELLRTGATVYLYNNGFIHAKTIVIDEEISSVGTANIDYRSFRLNFEVNAFLYDDRISKKLTEVFDEDLRVSRQLTMEEYLQRPRWIRIKESVSRLLSPIL
ncbi:major cardiolipin synthase ClsA [Paenibacillus sp. J23TS9]|uniref:Cardiolipin synthase n=1 Tax=Paenibacillus dokdonensis TaxID=2567944 RepID=A0ABU6GRZ9_9BACL|nr:MULTISPECIES: cardiolipin synthase [Paenibacillus]MEC0242496.1 cardiolipin synthase [Paenibacillus dokdonensis]GIP26850.1 major cardiolipin synthase ClsA [Paenibacillus sp. J23TS9]